MAKSDVDWSLLNWPIIVVTLSLLASFGLVHYSGQYREELNRAYDSEKRKLERISKELQGLVANARLFKEDMSKYQHFQQQGRYETVDRVALIETIEKVADQWRLSLLSYDVMPARSVAFSPQTATEADGSLLLHETRMNLTLGLLHEGDLLRVESVFKNRDDGLFEIRHCSLERLPASAQASGAETSAINFHARCQLSWYTLEIRAGSDDEA